MARQLGWWMCLLVGCTEQADPAGSTEGFTKETVLADADFETCQESGAFFGMEEVFWPASMFPVLGYGLAPVAPPYEITKIGAQLYQFPEGMAPYCRGDAGLDVQVWVGGLQPDRLPLRADGTPDLPALVQVSLATTFDDGQTVDGTEMPHQYVEVTLDPPVRVEETGTLWIAAVNHDAGDGAVGCLTGCGQGGGDTVYQWIPDQGWIVQTALPLFTVTVAHD